MKEKTISCSRNIMDMVNTTSKSTPTLSITALQRGRELNVPKVPDNLKPVHVILQRSVLKYCHHRKALMLYILIDFPPCKKRKNFKNWSYKTSRLHLKITKIYYTLCITWMWMMPFLYLYYIAYSYKDKVV